MLFFRFQTKSVIWALISIICWIIWLEFLPALALLVALYIHELGHALAARLQGERNVQIILFPLGGATISRIPRFAQDSCIKTLCGPLANLLFCFVITMPYYGGILEQRWILQYSSVIAAVNLVNLLPIAVLDGGHFFGSILCGLSQRVKIFIQVATSLIGFFILIKVLWPIGFWTWIFLTLLGYYSWSYIFRASREMKEMIPMTWLVRVCALFLYLYLCGMLYLVYWVTSQ